MAKGFVSLKYMPEFPCFHHLAACVTTDSYHLISEIKYCRETYHETFQVSFHLVCGSHYQVAMETQMNPWQSF